MCHPSLLPVASQILTFFPRLRPYLKKIDIFPLIVRHYHLCPLTY